MIRHLVVESKTSRNKYYSIEKYVDFLFVPIDFLLFLRIVLLIDHEIHEMIGKKKEFRFKDFSYFSMYIE